MPVGAKRLGQPFLLHHHKAGAIHQNPGFVGPRRIQLQGPFPQFRSNSDESGARTGQEIFHGGTNATRCRVRARPFPVSAMIQSVTTTTWRANTIPRQAETASACNRSSLDRSAIQPFDSRKTGLAGIRHLRVAVEVMVKVHRQIRHTRRTGVFKHPPSGVFFWRPIRPFWRNRFRHFRLHPHRRAFGQIRPRFEHHHAILDFASVGHTAPEAGTDAHPPAIRHLRNPKRHF